MKALWTRFDEAHDVEPIPGPSLNSALTVAALSWLDDRIVMDDVMAALRAALPEVPEEGLLAAIAAIGQAVRQP